MIKILSLVLAIITLFSLCACNKTPQVAPSAEESAEEQNISSLTESQEPETKKEENTLYASGGYVEHLETEDAYYVLCSMDSEHTIYCYDKDCNFIWSTVTSVNYNKGRLCSYNLDEGLLVYSKINGAFNAEYYTSESPSPKWQVNLSSGLEAFLPISNIPDKFFINRQQYIDVSGEIKSIVMDEKYGTVYPFYHYFEDANYIYLNVRDETSNAKTNIVALDDTYTPVAVYTFGVSNGNSYAGNVVYDSVNQRLYGTAQEYPNGEKRYRVVCLDKNLNVIFEKTYEEFIVVQSFDNGTLLVRDNGRYCITDLDLNVLMEEGSGSTPGGIIKSATGYNSVYPLDGEYRHIEYDENFQVVTYERVRGRAFVNNEGVLIKITA